MTACWKKIYSGGVAKLRSRETVRFLEEMMSADKYPSIFSRQVKNIVYALYLDGLKSLHNDQRLLKESKMAALAANSEMKTEHLSEALEMLERLITKIHKLCLLRRKETECLVQQCRDLLKPWPPKCRFDKKRDDSTENTAKAQMMQSGKPTMEGTVADSKATDPEKKDLAALENLLAKAQRAREIQTKIDEGAAKANNKKKASKTPLPVTSKPLVTQHTQQAAKQSSNKPSSKQPIAARKTASQKPAIKSTYSASYGRPPSAKSLVRPTSSKGSAKVYLDSILKKGAPGQMSRSGSSVKGHASSAKTDGGTSVNVSKKSATLIPGEKDPETHFKESLLALPSEKDPSVSAKSLDKLARDQISTEHAEFQACKLPVENIKAVTLNDVDNKSHDLTGRPDEFSGLGNLRTQSISEARDFQGDKLEPFDPFAEGADLALPGKYRKLKATSIRLFSEVRNIAEKGGVSSSCQHFLHRVESEFDMGDICTHNELQESANGILEEHEALSRLTMDVVQRSCNLTENSPWPEVYKCYRHWQMVLSKFNELQKRTQQLLEAEEQVSKQCPCGNCRLFDRDNPRDSFMSEATHSEGCVLLSSWLPEEIGDPGSFKDSGSRNDGMEFTYSSLKELSELIGLHHEVQLLCFQLYVKDLASEKLLPVLERLDPSDSIFVPLYRLVHGFLCGDNKVFPALVLDNL